MGDYVRLILLYKVSAKILYIVRSILHNHPIFTFELMVQLVTKKGQVCLVIPTIGLLCERRGKMGGEGVGPGPKTLPQAGKDRVDKRTIGVGGEEGLKNVDVDGSLDGKKVCVGSDGDICNRIFQL